MLMRVMNDVERSTEFGTWEGECGGSCCLKGREKSKDEMRWDEMRQKREPG